MLDHSSNKFLARREIIKSRSIGSLFCMLLKPRLLCDPVRRGPCQTDPNILLIRVRRRMCGPGVNLISGKKQRPEDTFAKFCDRVVATPLSYPCASAAKLIASMERRCDQLVEATGAMLLRWAVPCELKQPYAGDRCKCTSTKHPMSWYMYLNSIQKLS